MITDYHDINWPRRPGIGAHLLLRVFALLAALASQNVSRQCLYVSNGRIINKLNKMKGVRVEEMKNESFFCNKVR